MEKCRCGKDRKIGAQNKLLKTCGSIKCVYASRKGIIRKPEKWHKCLLCEKQTKRTYCSKKCADLAQTKYPTIKVCEHCHQTYTPINTTRGRPQKFCSAQCRKDSGNWHWSAQQGNLAQQDRKEPTRPERIVYERLDAAGIEYLKQYPIFHWIVDAYVPSANLIIQVDGDYWHGNPSLTKQEELEPRIRKRIGIDRAQEKWFEKSGYNLLRVWESELC